MENGENITKRFACYTCGRNFKQSQISMFTKEFIQEKDRTNVNFVIKVLLGKLI